MLDTDAEGILTTQKQLEWKMQE